MDQRPRQTRTTLRPTRRTRFPEESDETSSEVDRPAILPAAIGACGDQLLPARSDDRPPESGVGRVLVVQLWKGTELGVQLWKETDATPSFHGVSGMAAPD